MAYMTRNELIQALGMNKGDADEYTISELQLAYDELNELYSSEEPLYELFDD